MGFHNSYPFLTVLNIAVDAVGPRSDGPRVLLSLFVLDTLSWVCYKAIQWEAVKQAKLAYASGTSVISPMIFALLIAVVETTFKFIMSAIAPILYRWIEGADHFATGPLAVFTTRAYTISLGAAGFIAFVATPCMWATPPSGDQCDCTINATAAQIAEEAGICASIGEPAGSCPLPASALAWLYAAAYTLFYAGFNQLGDSCREMGRTLWLDAFQDVTLRFPGIGCWAVHRPATSARSISTYVSFLRMFYPAVGALLIFLAANDGMILWAFVVLCSLLGTSHGLTVAPPGHCGANKCNALINTLTEHVKSREHAAETEPARAELILPDGQHSSEHIAAVHTILQSTHEQPGEHTVLLRCYELYQRELGLVLFLVVARIPNLVAANITAYLTGDALILDTTAAVPDLKGGRARLGYAAIGAAITITALGYVVSLMIGLPAGASEDGEPKNDNSPSRKSARRARPTTPRSSNPTFRMWVARLWAMLSCVCLSSFFLLLPSTSIGQSAWARLGLTWAAILIFLPYVVPFKPMVDVMLDAFMLRYDDARSASLVYYAALLEVCVAWGLLGLTAIFTAAYGDFRPQTSTNCTAAELAAAALPEGAAPGGRSIAELEAGRERSELAAVLLMTGGIMFMGGAYFAIVDSYLLPRRRALSALVNIVAEETAFEPEAEASQSATSNVGPSVTSSTPELGQAAPSSPPPVVAV